MPVRKKDQQIRLVVIKQGAVISSKVVQGDYWGSGYDERANDDVASFGLPAGTYRVSFYPSGEASGSDAIVHLKVEQKIGAKFVRVDLKTQKAKVFISKMEAIYHIDFKKREGLAKDARQVTIGGNNLLGYIEPKGGRWRARDFIRDSPWTTFRFKTKEEAADYLAKLSPWRL